MMPSRTYKRFQLSSRPGAALALQPDLAAAAAFDAAVGGDIAALNATIASAFGVLHTAIFPKEFNINQEGVTTVKVDVTQPPTVALKASEATVREATRHLQANFETAYVAPLLQHLLASAITVACSAVSVTIGTQSGKPINATGSITFGAAVKVNRPQGGSGWQLTVTLSDATVTVPNEPTLSQLLTSVLAPQLLAYLNSSILATIAIPSLSLLGLTFQPPVLSTEETPSRDDLLVVYSGLAPVVPPDSGTAWPQGALFIAIDANALQAVAAGLLPRPGGNWQEWPFTADYGVDLAPTFSISPGSGNRVTGTLAADAHVSFTFHTPWILPNIDFSGRATGRASVAAGPVGGAEWRRSGYYH
jgi:hypothetical protein